MNLKPTKLIISRTQWEVLRKQASEIRIILARRVMLRRVKSVYGFKREDDREFT